jgi:hypothetical protein
VKEFWSVPKEWIGETAFVIAGGPSVTQEMVDRLRGRKVIAIKLSVEKAPWADFLFFADPKWFTVHKQIVKSFGQRVVTTADIKDHCLCLQKSVPFAFQTAPTALAVQRTSTTGAINLAAHLGARRIVLLGVDGKVGPEPGHRTHHHTPHALPKKPAAQVFQDQRRDLEACVEPLKRLGIECFNANRDSAMRMFPFIDLNQALESK